MRFTRKFQDKELSSQGWMHDFTIEFLGTAVIPWNSSLFNLLCSANSSSGVWAAAFHVHFQKVAET
jgi:hypothetical protein